MEILIENMQNKIEVSDEIMNIINTVAKSCLEFEEFITPSEISVILVDNDEIREINKEHRKMDKPTDVLSFPMVDMNEGVINSQTGDIDMDEGRMLLGDIVISMEKVREQAEIYGHSFERELAFLTAHGVFHLLGYDHEDGEQEKRMMDKQESVLAGLGLTR